MDGWGSGTYDVFGSQHFVPSFSALLLWYVELYSAVISRNQVPLGSVYLFIMYFIITWRAGVYPSSAGCWCLQYSTVQYIQSMHLYNTILNYFEMLCHRASHNQMTLTYVGN